jgi:pantoate--beta-alanine ligase
VRDLAFPVEIVGVSTVREADYLALSSRNAYLSAEERAKAVALPNALASARDAIRAGEPVADALEAGRNAMTEAGFNQIDYLALVDAATLEPLGKAAGQMRIIAAAKIGTTRLIDNLSV